MKTQPKKPESSSPVTAIAVAVIVVAFGGTVLMLRKSVAPTPHRQSIRSAARQAARDEARPSEHPAAQTAAAQTAAQPVPAVSRPPLAAPLPTRQWKLGDSFTYHVDSARQLASAGAPATH